MTEITTVKSGTQESDSLVGRVMYIHGTGKRVIKSVTSSTEIVVRKLYWYEHIYAFYFDILRVIKKFFKR